MKNGVWEHLPCSNLHRSNMGSRWSFCCLRLVAFLQHVPCVTAPLRDAVPSLELVSGLLDVMVLSLVFIEQPPSLLQPNPTST